MSIHVYYCQECAGTSTSFIVNQWYSKYLLPHTFLYKRAGILTYFFFMTFCDVKPQLVKNSCRDYTKQNITKSHMPMFIITTKLQYKPRSFSTADYI